MSYSASDFYSDVAESLRPYMLPEEAQAIDEGEDMAAAADVCVACIARLAEKGSEE
jgi:hypothetical protein